MSRPGLLVPRLAVEGPFGVAAPLGGFGVLRSAGVVCGPGGLLPIARRLVLRQDLSLRSRPVHTTRTNPLPGPVAVS